MKKFENVKLRVDDIEDMISTYEFLLWSNKGQEEEPHCERVLSALKKAIDYKKEREPINHIETFLNEL